MKKEEITIKQWCEYYEVKNNIDIKFAEWIARNHYILCNEQTNGIHIWCNEENQYTTSELLKIYKKEKIMTPIHYDNKKNYDVIDFIKDYDLNFNEGNVIKYVARAKHKGTHIKDLEKAIDYLERELQHLRKEQEQWIENNK